jgi:hypothetical protein
MYLNNQWVQFVNDGPAYYYDGNWYQLASTKPVEYYISVEIYNTPKTSVGDINIVVLVGNFIELNKSNLTYGSNTYGIPSAALLLGEAIIIHMRGTTTSLGYSRIIGNIPSLGVNIYIDKERVNSTNLILSADQIENILPQSKNFEHAKALRVNITGAA